MSQDIHHRYHLVWAPKYRFKVLHGEVRLRVREKFFAETGVTTVHACCLAITSCLANNAAERALRGIALGRKSWLFAGSDRDGQRAAFMLSVIGAAKLNDIDPQA